MESANQEMPASQSGQRVWYGKGWGTEGGYWQHGCGKGSARKGNSGRGSLGKGNFSKGGNRKGRGWAATNKWRRHTEHSMEDPLSPIDEEKSEQKKVPPVPCDHLLECGIHRCQRMTHEGLCEPCTEELTQRCYCGRVENVVRCAKNTSFGCGNICGRPLQCGVHTCIGQCHSGPCPPCRLSPDIVKTCPCGAKALFMITPHVRTKCEDPISTCGGTCNKSLSCGGQHKCPASCHMGQCPPCTKSQVLHCRCGATCQKVLCVEVATRKATGLLCERKCAVMRSCGRHKCGNICCPSAMKRGPAASQAVEHHCPLICQRPLSCGSHSCEETCHTGACPPCPHTMDQTISCRCGKTSLPPPLPCGTAVPECRWPCPVVRTCGHPSDDHHCHQGTCPSCPFPCDKQCAGGHTVMQGIACGAPVPSCGVICGHALPCGVHTCQQICHLGPCLKTEKCRNTCGQPLPCGHLCSRICHGTSKCSTSCNTEVQAQCPCGRQTKAIACQKFQQLKAHRSSQSSDPSNAVLDCDGECARLYRLHGLAEALQINGEKTRTVAQKEAFENKPRMVEVVDEGPSDRESKDNDDLNEGTAELVEERRQKQNATFQRLIAMMTQHRQTLQYEHRPQIHKEISADKVTTVCSRLKVHLGDDSAGGSAQVVALQGLGLMIGGKSLLQGATLRLQPGCRYALVGRNGVGKTMLLDRIAKCAIHGFPTHLRTWHMPQEVPGDDRTVLNTVLAADSERLKLLEEETTLLAADPPPVERLQAIATRLEEIGAETAVARATTILRALQFSPEMMNMASRQLSGGWRMRMALAQALFYAPDIMMLDEPTNHLDLRAVLWLQRYLSLMPHSLIIVSHDRAFLNNVTTHTIHLQEQQLKYYPGRFDKFLQWREQQMAEQSNLYQWQEKKREKLQATISQLQDRAAKDPHHDFGQIAARKKKLQALGAEKHADGKRWKWSVDGDRSVVKPIVEDPGLRFIFPSLGGRLEDPPSVDLQDVSFAYSVDGPEIITKLTLLVSAESRLGIVGVNGCGKSTLLKLICGILQPTSGNMFHHRNPRIGYFAQHHVDTLPLDLSPVSHLSALFPGNKTLELRTHLGAVGIHGDLALQPIGLLSGGQRARVAFSATLWPRPHILLLDEPTTHLDYDTMDALGEAVRNYEGGVIVISHDEHFVINTCERLCLLEAGQLRELPSFAVYKQKLEDALVDDFDF